MGVQGAVLAISAHEIILAVSDATSRRAATWKNARPRMSTPNYYTREYAPEDIQWVDGFAAPPAPGYRPFAALSAAFKLLVNKEDTRQVFEVFSALAGRDGLDLFARFVATPYGRRVVTEPVRLEHILGNRERLRRYPEGLSLIHI